ncbi:MAG: hypothetical protein RR214_01260, partial [Synergistaceae bacterium]
SVQCTQLFSVIEMNTNVSLGFSFVFFNSYSLGNIAHNGSHGQKISGCTANEINPVRSLSSFVTSLTIVLVHTGGSITPLNSLYAFACIIANVILSYLVGDTLYFMAIKQMGISLAIPAANTTPMLAAVTS